AAERIARIGRVGDHAARPDEIGDLEDHPRLRAGRMDVEVPGHATSLEATTVGAGWRAKHGQSRPGGGQTCWTTTSAACMCAHRSLNSVLLTCTMEQPI